MKAMEIAVLRIYIPNDEAHLTRVLEAIESFIPGGDVNIFELRSVIDKSGKRLPLDQQKSLMVEFFEESCRAQIFVDALHEDIQPATIVGSFVSLLAGDEPTEGEGEPQNKAEVQR